MNHGHRSGPPTPGSWTGWRRASPLSPTRRRPCRTRRCARRSPASPPRRRRGLCPQVRRPRLRPRRRKTTPSPAQPRQGRDSGCRVPSGARRQAVSDIAAPGREEGGPGEHPGRRRPALRERTVGRRRRRRRQRPRVLRRRSGPGRARQVDPGAGRLDAAGGEVGAAEAVRAGEGRQPAARSHRARVRALRPARCPHRARAARRATSRGTQGRSYHQHPVRKRQTPRPPDARPVTTPLPHHLQQPLELPHPQPGERLHPQRISPQHPSHTREMR